MIYGIITFVVAIGLYIPIVTPILKQAKKNKAEIIVIIHKRKGSKNHD